MGCNEDALKDLEAALQTMPENEEFKEAVTKCKESKQISIEEYEYTKEFRNCTYHLVKVKVSLTTQLQAIDNQGLNRNRLRKD